MLSVPVRRIMYDSRLEKGEKRRMGGGWDGFLVLVLIFCCISPHIDFRYCYEWNETL